MRKYTLILCLLISTISWSQSGIPKNMSNTLVAMQLEYLQPVEQAPNFIPSGEVKYFNYNFGIELDEGNTLVLVQTRKDDSNYIPQVMISALIATLATNDQDVEICMMQTNDNYLTETNSDWAIEALFTPKDNIGDYEIAYLKSIYKEGIGVANILYLAKSEINVQPILRFSN